MTTTTVPIHLFKGLSRLVPSEFEAKLLGNQKTQLLFTNQGWSEEAKSKGILIDLSQVRWVEMSAAGQLVLLVEYAKEHSVIVTVAFPLSDLSRKEKQHLIKLSNNESPDFENKTSLFNKLKVQRIKTLNYLKVINFDFAVECQHVKNGKVIRLYDFDYDTVATIPASQKEMHSPDGEHNSDKFILATEQITYNYKLIIPLTWINSASQSTHLKNFEELFSKIISQSSRGLDSVDALAINNVIISELTKNVLEHSDKEYGLIGAVLQPTNSLSKNNKDGYSSFSDHNPLEQEYMEWIAANSEYYIAIFFGDSGNGLIQKLKEAFELQSGNKTATDEAILRWSFDKWSTCKLDEEIRGTKGLYRIHRIVNKYNGMILVRSKESLGGFQKLGTTTSRWVYNRPNNPLSFLPGTFLKMHFAPYRELLKINTNQTEENRPANEQYEWISKTITVKHEIPEETFSGNLSLKKIFSNSNKNLLLILNIPEKINQLETEIDEIIIDHLKYLCLGRHPNGVLVYIMNKEWDALEAKIDSLNQLIFDHKIKPNSESLHPDKEDVYDPILIMGKAGQYTWVGDNKNTIAVLTELYADKSYQKKLTELDSFLNLDVDEQTKIIQFISNDNAILSLDNAQELRINFSDISLYFSSLFSKKVRQHMHSQDDNQIYLTPNLRYIRKWIDVRTLIHDEIPGYALALFLEFSRSVSFIKRSDSKCKILIDNGDNKELAEQFAMLIGVNVNDVVNIIDEIDGRLPRRNPIFDENDQVIVLTTIISSTETIRRSIKSVQRDLAHPIAVLGLLNQSESSEITTWGKSVPIVALITDVMQEIDSKVLSDYQLNKSVQYIEPFSFKQLSNYSQEDQNTNDKLLNLITSTKALHFNHFGKANGRHFTFYLNPNSMLSDDEKFNEFIVNKFKDQVDQWLERTAIKDFEIWMPTLDFKFGDPLGKISDNLLERYPSNKRKTYRIKRKSLYGEWALTDSESISIQPNLLIIDWGALTGSTIQQMVNLATKHEKENILVCVLFSQFSEQELVFYKNLHNVKIFKRKNEGDLFSQKVVKPASISINFIYKFPLKYYESFNCPVCEHIKALSDYEIKGYLMTDFSSKRRNRLKIKDKSIAEEWLTPQDFYSDFTDQFSELDSSLIVKMFKLRVLLHEAIESTRKREEVYHYLLTIKKNEEMEKTASDSELYALLYFLSVEIMWLQKPPLIFEKIRKIIADLAFQIAVWDRGEMEPFFSGDNKAVIRYKFAAISVLRSSDKKRFCEYVYEVFLSAKKDGQFSHNLTQNLFYHIHSLVLKKYHSSKVYFTEIIGGLELISKIEKLDSNVIYVIQYLKNLADKRRRSINLEGLSDLELIKSLKREIATYNGITDHSEIFEVFRRMAIENVEEPIKRLDASAEDYPVKLAQIEDWAKGLVSKWGMVSGFIESVVNNHLHKVTHLYGSMWFKQFRIHEYFPVEDNGLFIGYDDEFTKIINRVANKPKDAKTDFELYKSHYVRFVKGLFSSKLLTHEYDSKLISLLNELPTEINKNILNCINTFTHKYSRSTLISFTPSADEQLVFYPKEEFVFAINQILSNVEKHRVASAESACWITIIVQTIYNEGKEISHYTVRISNSGTVNNKKNKHGALSQVQNELRLFGGECNYDFDNEMAINLKFLNYGE